MKFLLLTLLIQSSLYADESIRTGQIVVGAEPVRSNYVLLFDNVKSIFRKLVLGKGEGILDPITKNNLIAQEKYMEKVRELCTDCVYEAVRESHGNISYKITFPDGYYIVSSIDAGALEWQTKPTLVQDFPKYQDRLKKYIYDIGQEMGLNKTIDGLGGHISQSGYGGDSFWIANTAKLRANNYDGSWGFFGKDSYNANIVARFNENQRNQYEMALRDHDKSWESFLKNLESVLDKESVDVDDVMDVFRSRKTMSSNELLQRLSVVYYNEKQQILPIGMRAKNKYVDTRFDPKREMIENRAIRPQQSSDEVTLLAKYFEAEAWFIKEKISAGYDYVPEVKAFKSKSRSEILSNMVSQVEQYGLDWEDYKVFSKNTISKSKEDLKLGDLNFEFRKVDYGASKRDDLFKAAFSLVLEKFDGSSEQVRFIADLMEEMSYTSKEAKINFNLFQKAIGTGRFGSLAPKDQFLLASKIEKMIGKFADLGKKMQGVRPYYFDVMDSDLFYTKDLSLIFEGHFANNPERHSWSYSHFRNKFQKKMTSASIQNFTTLFNNQMGSLTDSSFLEFFNDLEEGFKNTKMSEIPDGTLNIVKKAMEDSMMRTRGISFANLILDKVATGDLKATPEAFEIFQYLDRKSPVPERNKRFQEMFLGLIKKNQYAEVNFYKVKEYFSNLLQISEVSEHNKIIEDLLPKIEQAHAYAKAAGPHSGKSNEIDLQMFIKKLREKQKANCLLMLN